MESRLTKLEAIILTLATREDLARLEGKVDTAFHRLETTIYEVKATIHKELNSQTWKIITWMTGLCSALFAAGFYIAGHIS